MQTKLMSLTITSMIEHYLKQNPIEQGIVGIQLPEFITVDTTNSVVNELFLQRDIQVLIIPPPLTSIFSSDENKDIKAIGGRVQRDQLDGIRYNRVYIALYWDDLGSSNAHHHDIFFKVEEDKVSGGYSASVSDNREFGGDTVKLVKLDSGDKVTFANQMETVVDMVTRAGEEKPAEMLFSLNSTILRKPADWWVELPEFVDKKSMTEGLLKLVQDNEQQLTHAIQVIKDGIARNLFGPGIILEFPTSPNVKAIMRDGPRGMFVRIHIGTAFFFFSLERAIMYDWYTLMIDQLNVLTKVNEGN